MTRRPHHSNPRRRNRLPTNVDQNSAFTVVAEDKGITRVSMSPDLDCQKEGVGPKFPFPVAFQPACDLYNLYRSCRGPESSSQAPSTAEDEGRFLAGHKTPLDLHFEAVDRALQRQYRAATGRNPR